MRRWLSMGLMGLIPAVYLSAFLAMALIRSRQGGGEEVYPSLIEPLAVHTEPADPLADARGRGREVYLHYCQICHGESGRGDGFNASRLDPPPRDFTDAKLWQQTSDERFYYAVARGGPSIGESVLMPAWGRTLTERQIRDVIVFIRAFAAPATPSGK